MILVSSCLCGENCKYNGGNNTCKPLLGKYEAKDLVKICPEVMGGLTTPREPAEIVEGTAQTILLGEGKICTKSGQDVTKAFLEGAYESLKIAKKYNIKKAILKAKSPSCGCGKIYNGEFKGVLREGNGLTAELLKQNGIVVVTEESIT